MTHEQITTKERTQTSVELRPLSPADLEYAREMRNKFKTAFYRQEEITPEMQAAWYEGYLTLPREIYTLFVVYDGETRIGTTSLARLESDLWEFGNNTIDDQFQGKSYFSAIYKAAKARVNGGRLWATIMPGNDHMVRIYEHYGFEHKGQDERGLTVMEEPAR